jgi:TonB family protein
MNRILHSMVQAVPGTYLAVYSTIAAGARLVRSFRVRTWAATAGLLSCVFFAAGMTASAQFQIVGPAPVSVTVARQRIRTLLENADPANRQQTIKEIFGLVNWYRDLLDEELIAAWQKEGRANLTEVLEPLADSRVAAGVVEFSWRQQRQATFTPAFAPMLGRLMARYPDSAKPFFDDLLGSTAPGRQALDLSQPEAEAVCRILLDMPDIGTFKKSALRILPRYRRAAESLLDKDLHGDDREKMYRASRWLTDLATVDSAFAVHNTASATATRPTPVAPAANVPASQSVPDPAGASRRLSPPASPAASPDGFYRAGNGVSQPIPVSKAEPEYSPAARKLLTEGTVVLQIVVQPDGTPRDFRVMRSLGYGLDEKAIEAVRRWRYTPGMKDGNAVSAVATIEINFSMGLRNVPDRWASGRMAFALEAGVTPPVAKDGAMPKTVREVGDEGVVLNFTVDSNGSVKNIHSIYGSQSASELLARSLTNWKFQPAVKSGQSVEATGTVLFAKGKGDEAANRLLSPSPLPRMSSPAAAANGGGSNARPTILAERDPDGAIRAPVAPGGVSAGSVYRPGGGVSAPAVTSQVPPEYSQEAQNARRGGTVVLSVVVDAEGYARDIKVLESLGMGLDQKAIEAVQKWRFRPGYKDGRAVNVLMQVEVLFRVQ